MRLGSGAGNLAGARSGAERIAWVIDDVLGKAKSWGGEEDDEADEKIEYATGTGNRFESLGLGDGEETQ